MDPLRRLESTAHEGRASSAPPFAHPIHTSPVSHASGRSGSGFISESPVLSQKETILAAHLDILPELQRSIPSVVKSRNGSVLSRGFILKTDHYPSGKLRVSFIQEC